MAPQPSWRGERSLDGTQFVHEAQSSPMSMSRRGSSSSSSRDDRKRTQGSSNRNNRPQLDSTNANLTANVDSPNNSKFQNKPNNPSSSPGNPPPFTFIQNNDPRVNYSAGWTLKGNKFVTVHSTTTMNATVSLKFNGTSIVVFGTVPKSDATATPPPTAVFVVDSNPPVQTEAPTADSPIPNQPLFAVNPLSENTEHDITITLINGSAPFILESFFISTGSSDSPTTNGTATTTEMTVNGTDVSAPYTSSSSSSTTTSESRAGLKVAAGILATLLIVIVIAAAFLLIHRRRKAQRRTRTNRISAFTAWTSTESILEATGPSLYNSNLSGRNSRRSDFRNDGRISYMTQSSHPPPLPPKALLG